MGFTNNTLETKATVTLEPEGKGFRITRSDPTLTASVSGIDPDRFEAIAFEAKPDCPASRLLAAVVTLHSTVT